MKLVLVCLFMIPCSNVTSYSISITRHVQDVYTDQGGYVNKICGYQSCTCGYSNSTFLRSKLSCVSNLELRNKSRSGDWKYLLRSNYDANYPIKVVNLSQGSIKFKININDPSSSQFKMCNVTRIEYIDKFGNWVRTDTKRLIKKVNIQNKVNISLQLNSKKARKLQSDKRARVVRLQILCDLEKNGNEIKVDDYLVFKIPGTISVEKSKPVTISMRSTTTIQSSYHVVSPTSRSTMMSSISATIYPESSSEIRPFPTVFTSRAIVKTTSIIPQPLVSSGSVTASSNTQKITSTRSSILIQTILSTSGTTKVFKISSPIIPSSPSSIPATTRSEAMSSADVPVPGIIGGVLGGFVILVFAILLLAIFLKKHRMAKGLLNSPITSPGGKNQSLIFENTGEVPLPTLSNPVFQEGMYENPEDVHKDKKHQSGVNSVESPAYDRCLIVENPSARSENVKSVYDNVAGQQDENSYKSLDSTKREAFAKYQSLLANPRNKNGTTADDKPTTPLQEAVYSVLDDDPSNVVNTSSGQAKQPKTDECEPVYDVLEGEANTAGTKNEPDYNILEQSTKSEGKRDPVYSVLEDE